MSYKVSVIVELVKNKKKLKQTLNSLKNQTLDFEREIQVFLWTNNRVEAEYLQFCEEYANTFGGNVVFGNSLDFSQVKGAWISCLQEGQEWTPSAFETVIQMAQNSIDPIDYVLEKYKEDTEDNKTENYYDFVLNQMWKFQGELGKYIFSRKYDVEVEKIIHSKEKLEVMYQLAIILLKSQNMIVLEKEQLIGKKRYETKTQEWYFAKLPDFGEEIQRLKIEQSRARKEQLELVYMTQLAESMKDKVENILTEDEIVRYEVWLKGELMKLDDAVINRANMNAATRRYAFSLKDGKDMAGEVVCRNGKFYYKNMVFFDMRNGNPFVMKPDEAEQNKIVGISYHPLLEEKITFYLTDGVKDYPFVYKGDGEKIYKCVNHIERQERKYECILPDTVKFENLHLECVYLGHYVTCLE